MEFIQLIEQYAWIGWIALILVFFAIEALTLDMTFLMLGLGGVLGLASGLVGAPLWLQVVVAAVAAALFILLLRPPLLRRVRRGEDPTPSNVDALIGLTGIVIASVGRLGGQVKLANGDVWSAKLTGSDEADPGSPIVVESIEGATAVVRIAEEAQPR